jgi:predicted O-methyltransferase YrrM
MHPFPARCPEPRISESRSKADPRDQALFHDVCSLVKPESILEVGSWMGSSAIAWAHAASDYRPDSVVYCVDTWLGSVEHFLSSCGETWNIEKLSLSEYGPTFFDDFLRNVWDYGLQDKIRPLRAASSSAMPYFAREGLQFDVVYVDGAHDFHSVCQDVSEALKLISPKGLVCGDDFWWGSVKAGLREVAVTHPSPLHIYEKLDDFVILTENSAEYEPILLKAGYSPWGPSPMRRSLKQLFSKSKGFLMGGFSHA